MKDQSLTRRALLASTALLAVPTCLLAATASPPGAMAYIISPRPNAKVKSPFRVQFGLKGMGVTHAGDDFKNSGHHHLLVDATGTLDPESPIPSDKNHMHFGGGQTETMLDLPKGPHTLQLVLGDANHVPFNPLVQSTVIHITVI